MAELYVIDTCSIINYFDDVFGEPSVLSPKARYVISQALRSSNTEIRLSVPSIVFIEIFEKWLKKEEFVRKFYYEVFEPFKRSPNVEIKPIEQEVIEILLSIGGNLEGHEINDKIILASAIMLNCPLITSDPEIIRYVNQNNVIPAIIS